MAPIIKRVTSTSKSEMWKLKLLHGNKEVVYHKM